MSDRKIKLIWDFRGPDAEKTAEHHAKHLGEFALAQNLTEKKAGHKAYSPSHSIAFLVVSQDEMTTVRDALKPHRGEFCGDR